MGLKLRLNFMAVDLPRRPSGAGAFRPSETEWRFLGDGIFEHNGYGWGSHSWTVDQGADALRVVCTICGIQQPLRIKGESLHRPLSILLQEILVRPKDGSEGLGC
jgi:hypothetical protein